MVKNIFIGIGVVLILAAFGLWIWGFFMQFPPELKELSTLAELGDWLGGGTAAFINIAGFMMIYVAFLQQKEATQQANKNLSIQKFESTFFNLLNLHYQSIHNLQTGFNFKEQKNFFEAIREFLNRDLNGEIDMEEVKKSYQKYYDIHLSSIDQFIRHLALITEYIHTTKVFGTSKEAKEEKQKYFNILFSQLSTNQLFLIFYHTYFFDKSFKTKLVEYDLLVSLKKTNILIGKDHWNQYHQTP